MINTPTLYGFQVGTRVQTPLLLDVYTGSLLAFSFRKLSNSYTGDCCIVRRSSDNAEQSIGFRADGWIDIDALETFCGAGNGFVSKWFDQSGNGYHATSSATTKQMRIVQNGTIHSSSLGAPYMMSVDATGNQHVRVTASLDLETTSKRFCSIHIGTMATTGGTGRVRPFLSQFGTQNYIHAYGDVNSSTGHNDGAWRYTDTIKSTATLQSWAVHRYGDGLFRLMRDSYTNGQNQTMASAVDRGSGNVYIAAFLDPDATSRRYNWYSEVVHWNDSAKTQAELEGMFSYMNQYLSGSG